MKLPEELYFDDLPQWLWKCPAVCHWVEYKGEIYFAMINTKRSLKARRPMLDLSHCATTAFNNIVEKTVAYDQKKFVVNPKSMEL